MNFRFIKRLLTFGMKIISLEGSSNIHIVLWLPKKSTPTQNSIVIPNVIVLSELANFIFRHITYLSGCFVFHPFDRKVSFSHLLNLFYMHYYGMCFVNPETFSIYGLVLFDCRWCWKFRRLLEKLLVIPRTQLIMHLFINFYGFLIRFYNTKDKLMYLFFDDLNKGGIIVRIK